MTEVELGYVDAETPITDGMLAVSRDPFDYPVPDEQNPGAINTATYSFPDGPSDTGWFETRTLVMFDFAGVAGAYEVLALRVNVVTVMRHRVDSATFEAFAYSGPETAYPFDLDRINPAGSWGDLSGNANIIAAPIDFDAWIAALGGSVDPLVNVAGNFGDNPPAWEFSFSDTSWADGRAGSAAGIVLAQRMPYPSALDSGTFPNAGTDPSNRTALTNVRLVVDAGALEPLEIEASGVIRLGGVAGIAAPPRRSRFHRARLRRDQRG